MLRLEPGIETGIVKFFDSRNNKRYGFIILTTGEEIFFHFNDGMIPEVGMHSLEWFFANRTSETVLDYPKVGERLFFEKTVSAKGYKAYPWTSEKYYKQVTEKLICPCGHHLSKHMNRYCEDCDCPDFGEPTETWETHTEVNLGGDPGGFTICE